MDRMNLSLDQIMATKPKPAKAKKVKAVVKAKKNTPVKAKRATKDKVSRPAPVKKPSFRLTAVKAPAVASASIFTRLGNPGNSKGPSGSLVVISKLNRDITASDIAELVGRSGETRRVELKYDSNGRSVGMAEVLFAKQSDAVGCVKLLNGVTLDGRAMEVKLANKGNGGATVVQRDNVRVGLFGTAAGGGRRNSRDQQVKLVQPFNGNNKPKQNGGISGRRNSNDSGKSKGDTRKGGRGGAGAGASDRGAGKPKPKAKAPRAPRAERPTKSSADLDAEMDAYMATK